MIYKQFCVILAFSIAIAVPAQTTPTKAPSGVGVIPWTEARVRDWQPKPSERMMDTIGWSKDILSAKALARQHNRPVFLFTMDGRMNIGRC